MRFNHLMNLIAFPGKVHGKPPASGFVATNKMPESRALSKFLAVLNSYIPLSAPSGGELGWGRLPGVFIYGTSNKSVIWVFIPTRRSCEGRNLCPQRFRFLPSQERRGQGLSIDRHSGSSPFVQGWSKDSPTMSGFPRIYVRFSRDNRSLLGHRPQFLSQ